MTARIAPIGPSHPVTGHADFVTPYLEPLPDAASDS